MVKAQVCELIIRKLQQINVNNIPVGIVNLKTIFTKIVIKTNAFITLATKIINCKNHRQTIISKFFNKRS